MVDLRKLSYRTVAILKDGTQLDISESITDLGWEEGEREYSARISLKLYDAFWKNKKLSELIQPMTPLVIYAGAGNDFKEVVRGTIEEWSPTYTESAFTIDITAYDAVKALRQSQDDQYFPDGMSTKQILTTLFNDWGVPFEYAGPEVTHAKWMFKKNYISDIVQKILDDVRKKGKGFYFMRAKEGKVQVIERGSNEDIYCFGTDENIIQTKDVFSISNLVTRVKIIGKTKDESRPPVEAVVDGKTEFGIRQVILERAQNKTLDEVTKSANQVLAEKGNMKRITTIQCPDVPFIRKGDKIRICSGFLKGDWFINSVRHNAADMKMSLKIVGVDSNGVDAVTSDEMSNEED